MNHPIGASFVRRENSYVTHFYISRLVTSRDCARAQNQSESVLLGDLMPFLSECGEIELIDGIVVTGYVAGGVPAGLADLA